MIKVKIFRVWFACYFQFLKHIFIVPIFEAYVGSAPPTGQFKYVFKYPVPRRPGGGGGH